MEATDNYNKTDEELGRPSYISTNNSIEWILLGSILLKAPWYN